jgi:1-acyl-sn-glycerol-3-phosphate acyltransferase
MQRLLSAATWLLIAVIVVVGFLWMCLVFAATAWRDPGRYTVGRWFRRIGVAAVKVNPLWDFRTSGVVISDPRRPYVAVANHESFADIFLISHLPWEMKWLSKEAIFRIPVMGWMMRMAGDIAVRRSDRRSRADALQACRDRLRKGVTVMILPEGTRSPHGELLPFHVGAFKPGGGNGAPGAPHGRGGDTRGHAQGVPPLQPGAGRGPRPRARRNGGDLGPGDVQALRDRVRSLIGEARDELLAELGPRSRPSP